MKPLKISVKLRINRVRPVMILTYNVLMLLWFPTIEMFWIHLTFTSFVGAVSKAIAAAAGASFSAECKKKGTLNFVNLSTTYCTLFSILWRIYFSF